MTEALLLDMGGTFMFGCDRFSDPAELHATYERLGGARLGPGEVHEALSEAIARLERLYVTPDRYDEFPPVRPVLADCPAAAHLAESEIDLLAEVFALHEVGTVPDRSVDVLERLAQNYRLGVVSNVWAPSGVFVRALEAAAVLPLFEVVVFSSDHGCVKPSAKLFGRALTSLRLPPERVVFVGDDLRCDVGGAQAVGLGTVWIDADGRPIGPRDPVPDRVVGDLGELLPGWPRT